MTWDDSFIAVAIESSYEGSIMIGTCNRELIRNPAFTWSLMDTISYIMELDALFIVPE